MIFFAGFKNTILSKNSKVNEIQTDNMNLTFSKNNFKQLVSIFKIVLREEG